MCEAEEGIVQPVAGKKRDRLVLDETDDSSAQVLIAAAVAMNRKMTKRCLEQLGLHCDEAVDGAEAVAMCAIKRYRLVSNLV
jgi:PleD family two-component response regulator